MNPVPEYLLTLITPVNVAESIEDLLLARSDLVSGFTSIDAHGHGSHLPLLSVHEQVSGHAPRKHIEIICGEPSLRLLLKSLKEALPQSNIYYWLTPVIEKGRL